jgi:hypothetical protein
MPSDKDPGAAEQHIDFGDTPFPWLVNLEPAEYEWHRRSIAREYGWRLATLDRLYRAARRKAGRPWLVAGADQ